MPYQAEQDVTIPRKIGQRVNQLTGESVELKESVNYVAGAIVFEKNITPDVLTRLEEGDDHLSTLLRYVDVAEARQILGHQVQAAASQPSSEGEILHSEERLGGGANSSSPTVSPAEVDVAPEPPYEAPPVSTEVSDSGTSDTTEPPSVETEGSTESSGESTDAVEVVEETESESTTEDQETGHGPASENQEATEAAVEEITTDKYDGMDFAVLKAEVKDRKIPGRSKLKTEDELRAALRAADSE